MNEHTSLHGMLRPMEAHLSNYAVASGGATCVRAVTHDVLSLSGWSMGEPSSRLSSQNQMNDDGMEMEHGWTTSCSAHIGGGTPSEERLLEPTSTLFPGRHNIGHNDDQDRRGPSFLQGSGSSSSSSYASQNFNLNAGYVGNSGNVGTLSEDSSFMVEENNDAGLSLDSWGISCKRKALECTSAQSCSAGSSSCFPLAENSVSVCYGASSSLSLSSPSRNSLGVGMRTVEDCFPSSGCIVHAESCPRSFGRIGDPRRQQEAVPFNLSSRVSSGCSHASTHLSQITLPFTDSLELRSISAVGADTNSAQNQPHAVHVSAFSRNVHRFPWSGASSSRSGHLSNSFLSGERGAALKEEGNTRNIQINNAEHPMFGPSVEMRNMVQDSTGWGLATGSSSGGISLTARTGSNSSSHPLPTSAWIPHHNPSTDGQQRLSEFPPWSLFPSAPQNLNLNAGVSVGNSGCGGGQGMGTGLGQNLCNSSGLKTEQASLVSASSDKVGTSSGSSGFMVEENNGNAGSSLGCLGLSCKRKALESTSAESCSAGSSSCFPQAENGFCARYNVSSSLTLSPPLQNSPSDCPPELPNPRFGVGVRVVEDGFPPSGIIDNTENRLRSFGRREDPRHLEETVPFNLSSRGSSRWSNIASPQLSTIPLPFIDSLELRSEALVSGNINAPQIQPHAVHASAFSRNVHHFPWRGASSSRVGGSRERGAVLQEEGNGRSIPRNNAEHTMFVPSAEMRNMVRVPTSWSSITGSSSRGVSSTTRIGSSSSFHPLPGSARIPPTIPSTYSHRLMSEIRQVLNAMRQGENVQIEDYMLFEPFIFHGTAQVHDRYRDMRLDVDDMSYEELLALEELIGDVNTGLSSETIMKIMKQKKYMSIRIESPSDQEPCCICQEEYTNGDNLGTLDCGHDFHTDCIKQWLMQKNVCPICKTTALPAREGGSSF